MSHRFDTKLSLILRTMRKSRESHTGFFSELIKALSYALLSTGYVTSQ